jgi:predicted metal-binding membrane protein
VRPVLLREGDHAVFDAIKLPQLARNPIAWSLTLLLALLAWIPTLQQTLSMLSMQMYGTMGLSFAPFLLFWTIMMTAMMLPALAPILSIRFELLHPQSPTILARIARMIIFILGYLLTWCLFGIPVFFLCLYSEQLILHAPPIAIGLGLILFLGVGLYQLTPLKKRSLVHSNPAFYQQHPIGTSVLSDLQNGLSHGLACLGSCGGLMLMLVAVGLMNLTWMIIVTVLIFLEKTWHRDHSLSFYIGMALIFYAIVAAADPSLLPNLYIG